MVHFFGVKDVAEELRYDPQTLSRLLYIGAFPDADAHCPIVRGRRLIPADYVPVIRTALEAREAEKSACVNRSA